MHLRGEVQSARGAAGQASSPLFHGWGTQHSEWWVSEAGLHPLTPGARGLVYPKGMTCHCPGCRRARLGAVGPSAGHNSESLLCYSGNARAGGRAGLSASMQIEASCPLPPQAAPKAVQNHPFQPNKRAGEVGGEGVVVWYVVLKPQSPTAVPSHKSSPSSRLDAPHLAGTTSWGGSAHTGHYRELASEGGEHVLNSLHFHLNNVRMDCQASPRQASGSLPQNAWSPGGRVESLLVRVAGGNAHICTHLEPRGGLSH